MNFKQGINLSLASSHYTPSPLPYPPWFPSQAFTTRALVSGTQKSRRTARKALSVTRHGSSLTRKRRHQGIDRVPFLNQGLAQAAHTRLFSTTEDTAAPSTTSTSTEEEVSGVGPAKHAFVDLLVNVANYVCLSM